MTAFKTICAAAIAVGISAASALAESPVLRASVLKFGTVSWELDTIKHHGLDAANGFELHVNGVANGSAAKVAFQGGETDVIVSDWLWVARQRAAGAFVTVEIRHTRRSRLADQRLSTPMWTKGAGRLA